MAESKKLSTPVVGKLFHYKRRLVYIVDGQYTSGGRISNFWHWRPVRKDGTLGKEEGDYLPPLRPCTTHDIVITVRLARRKAAR